MTDPYPKKLAPKTLVFMGHFGPQVKCSRWKAQHIWDCDVVCTCKGSLFSLTEQTEKGIFVSQSKVSQKGYIET